MLRFTMQFWFMGPALALFAMGTPLRPVAADPPQADRWSIVVSTSPHHPQDVWYAAMGNNVDGWNGGGSICLNHLAQGFEGGEQLTLLIDVVEAGIVGVDGSPVPDGTYTFPGIDLPDGDYTVTSGITFYTLLDAYVVQSKLPEFEVGQTVGFMFMWDYAPGRNDREMVLWADFGFGLFPFLNEGTLMANTRLDP